MAIKKICPECGNEVISADISHDWTCPHCGALIAVSTKGEPA